MSRIVLLFIGMIAITTAVPCLAQPGCANLYVRVVQPTDKSGPEDSIRVSAFSTMVTVNGETKHYSSQVYSRDGGVFVADKCSGSNTVMLWRGDSLMKIVLLDKENLPFLASDISVDSICFRPGTYVINYDLMDLREKPVHGNASRKLCESCWDVTPSDWNAVRVQSPEKK